MKQNTRVPFVANTVTSIVEASPVIPLASYTTSGGVTLNGIYYGNYIGDGSAKNSKGCSGLVVAYSNASWSAEGVDHVIVNYRSNVFGSQYGGNTYEDRGINVSIACSEIITTATTWYDLEYGDTFISYFDVSTILVDLAQASLAASWTETVYVPLESSINCDLRCNTAARHVTAFPAGTSMLRQEYAGDHIMAGTTYYYQTEDLYLYNTVYSQQTSIQSAISTTLDVSDEIVFDCMVKVSNSKINGELSDSWTKFGVNEYIEVDSIHGPINIIDVFNDKLFYFQDKGFGILSVNDRSLITDNSSSQLVLGTGGVLDRYDYVSTKIGSKDKFSLAKGTTGLFWYDRINNFLIKYSDGIDKISVSRGIQSYLNTNVLSTQSVISHQDMNNNEILFTFFIGGTGIVTTSFTLAYSENVDTFISFYSFIPNIYIPYNNRYLTTTRSKYCSAVFNLNYLFLHDSDIYPRCNFYAITNNDATKYYDSTLKLLYNDDYLYTKVWDNIFYMSNAYNTSGTELYNQTVDSIRCYNDYQNTDYVVLVYPTNIVRRERGWALVIPRNLVDIAVTGNPDIFAAATLDQPTRLFRERLRDKYMVMDLKFINGATRDKFVLSNVGVKYRLSYR
jgi:hypothetical protein